MKTHIKNEFLKQLDVLLKEIQAYPNEESLWLVKGQISNPAGTLALHLAGNLNHFIGAQLGHTGYIRQRDKEFSDKNIPVAVILDQLEKTKVMLAKTFEEMDETLLHEKFPLDNFGDKTVHEVLLIVLSHLNYHLGQINYHRRLVTG